MLKHYKLFYTFLCSLSTMPRTKRFLSTWKGLLRRFVLIKSLRISKKKCDCRRRQWAPRKTVLFRILHALTTGLGWSEDITRCRCTSIMSSCSHTIRMIWYLMIGCFLGCWTIRWPTDQEDRGLWCCAETLHSVRVQHARQSWRSRSFAAFLQKESL